jgi:hypothetical protein
MLPFLQGECAGCNELNDNYEQAHDWDTKERAATP